MNFCVEEADLPNQQSIKEALSVVIFVNHYFILY